MLHSDGLVQANGRDVLAADEEADGRDARQQVSQEIAQGPPSKVLRDPRVIEVYLGSLRPLGSEAASTDA